MKHIDLVMNQVIQSAAWLRFEPEFGGQKLNVWNQGQSESYQTETCLENEATE